MEIIALSNEHLVDVVRIGNERFGEDYLNHNLLKSQLERNSLVGFVAMDGDTLAGFVYGYQTSVSVMIDIKLKEFFQDLLLPSNEPIGIFKTIAVSREYAGKGLGKTLANALLKKLVERTPKVYTVIWKQSENKSNEIVFGKLGFKEITTVQNYWESESLQLYYSCNICGSPPCKCSAAVLCYDTRIAVHKL